MKLLFCRNPDMKKLPDPAFEAEFEAAKESGFSCHLFGLDDFLGRRTEQAFAQLPAGHGETLLYRGWMMTEGEYRRSGRNLAWSGLQWLIKQLPKVKAKPLPSRSKARK